MHLFHIPISGLYRISINYFVTQCNPDMISLRRILLEIIELPSLFNRQHIMITSKFRLSIMARQSVQFVFLKFPLVLLVVPAPLLTVGSASSSSGALPLEWWLVPMQTCKCKARNWHKSKIMTCMKSAVWSCTKLVF